MDEELFGILIALISGASSILFYCLSIQQRMAQGREHVIRNQSRVDRIINSADLEEIQTEVVMIVSETIREPVKRIELEVDFAKDLKVPPGEMEVLFDEVDESFQIELERSKVRTFKDLLWQICDQRSS